MPSLPVLDPRPATRPRAARLSITDRCDLACVYCRPHRHDGLVRERLDRQAWRSIAKGLRRAGIERVRITGGEPLVHADVVGIVSDLASAGFSDLAMTTNGTQLARLARPLREAGLMRLNVSLDSLDARRFFRLTRGGSLAQVLRGIEASLAAGFRDIKSNTVVLAGENDDELEAIVGFCHGIGIVPRFLELMPMGEGAAFRALTVAEMKAALRDLLAVEDEAQPEPDRGPARYLRRRGAPAQRVGFVSGTSAPFCAGCDRLRVTSDGSIRACLAVPEGVSLGKAAGAERVADAIERAWTGKPDGETFRGAAEPPARRVAMRYVGG
jgi:cyclic pyranopterin phosphate synthase